MPNLLTRPIAAPEEPEPLAGEQDCMRLLKDINMRRVLRVVFQIIAFAHIDTNKQ